MREGQHIERARRLRTESTDAERRLWHRLRQRQLDGWRFRRQAPIGPFIADFLCVAAKLIVELDGGQHAERIAEDAARTRWLEGRGFVVLRFWNDDALLRTDAVLEGIIYALDARRRLPPP